MWIYLLVGLGVGVLAVMFTVVRQEKRYRVLFSDTHLAALAEAVSVARGGAIGTTFEGLSVGWFTMPGHVAVRVTSKKPIARPAQRFLLAFVDVLVRGREVDAEAPIFLAAGNTFAVVWTRASGVSAEGGAGGAVDLAGLRAVAADRMGSVIVAEGTIEAYA